ncbi:MAG: aldehyde ferredoxin oxidoreductase family protein [Candidatus Woesearchaeota archaeon]
MLDENFARKFIGGYGFVARTLLDIPREADPLGPDNILCFWLGPFAGTLVPTSSKYSVGAKSPLTNMIGFGISSGYFGSEFRRAGWDGIVIRGKSEKLVYIFIDDDIVRIVDAEHLRGKTTWETEDLIKEQHHDNSIRVASIGPAGEKLVRIACITNCKNRQVGRTGMGCVMGSKNLKAIAVRGTGATDVFDLKGLAEFCKELNSRCQGSATEKYRIYGTPANVLVHQKLGCLPTRNFQQGTFENADKVSGQTMLKTKVKKILACEGCAVACDHFNIIEDGPYKGAMASVDYESLWSFGPNCGIDNLDAITKAVQICDTNGIDTISAGMIVSWAMECFEKGLLTIDDTEGINLVFGNHEAMVETVRKMSLREGRLGNLLAEGTRRAANIIGKDSIKYAMQCKGMEWGGYSMRSLQTSTLGYATSVRGACYLRSGSYQYDVKGEVDRFSLDQTRGKLVKDGEDIYALIDSLIICKFTRNIYKNNDELASLYYLVTGVKVKGDELVKAGERIHNVAKIFNIKHGWKREDDYPPWRAFNEYLKDKQVIEALKKKGQPNPQGAIINREEYEAALNSYYEVRGWDYLGLPKKEKLSELEIYDLW